MIAQKRRHNGFIFFGFHAADRIDQNTGRFDKLRYVIQKSDLPDLAVLQSIQ